MVTDFEVVAQITGEQPIRLRRAHANDERGAKAIGRYYVMNAEKSLGLRGIDGYDFVLRVHGAVYVWRGDWVRAPIPGLPN